MFDYEARMKKIAIKALEVVTDMNKVAPIEFSFGYVDSNNQCRQGLVIKKCAPIVITTLHENGYILSMTEYGLLVVDNLNY